MFQLLYHYFCLSVYLNINLKLNRRLKVNPGISYNSRNLQCLWGGIITIWRQMKNLSNGVWWVLKHRKNFAFFIGILCKDHFLLSKISITFIRFLFFFWSREALYNPILPYFAYPKDRKGDSGEKWHFSRRPKTRFVI